jgi:hypothetical protein
MSSETDNKANYKTSDNGINVPQISYQLYLSATQTPDEEDSYGNTYDANINFDNSQIYLDKGYTALSSGSVSKDTFKSGAVVLTSDVTDFTNDTISSDIVLELNNNTIIPSDMITSRSTGSDLNVSMSNGTYLIDKTGNYYYTVYGRPNITTTVNFENMKFISTATAGTTDYAKPVKAFQYISYDSGKGVITFKNCTFDQTIVVLTPRSSAASASYDVVFENCTFNMTGSSTPILIENNKTSLSGSVTIKNSTFNLATTGNIAAVSAYASGTYDNFNISFENTVINGSLYEGTDSGTVGIYKGPASVLLNGKQYSSIAEFNASVTDDQVKLTGTLN